MNTPPKAVCHSCGGTGIDPTVGFLDCEFCTPATTGVSLSAPEQPEPKCATCNDHGEIGCLRPDGYDGEPCPECTPEPGKGVMDAVLHWRLKHAVANRKCSALQERLNVADQRNDDLETELKVTKQALNSLKGERASTVQCQFPQACTTRCDCDIPDFSPGNGNKARRRAEAVLGLKIVEDPTLAPGEIKMVQPLPKCVDPFTVCLGCFGSGTICTGIEEASSTICNGCNGTGREQA